MKYKGMVLIDDADDSIHDGHLQKFKGNISTVLKSGTVTRLASDNIAVQNVANLGFSARIVYLLAVSDDDAKTFSNGWGDGIANVCTRAVVGVMDADVTKAANVQAIGNGWTARVLGNPQGFDLDWTKVGQGLNVTVSYLAIK